MCWMGWGGVGWLMVSGSGSTESCVAVWEFLERGRGLGGLMIGVGKALGWGCCDGWFCGGRIDDGEEARCGLGGMVRGGIVICTIREDFGTSLAIP